MPHERKERGGKDSFTRAGQRRKKKNNIHCEKKGSSRKKNVNDKS